MAIHTTLHVYVNQTSRLTGEPLLISPFLNAGEPYIVEEPTMEICRLASDFLRDRYVENAKRHSVQTWRAAAFALKFWLQFLRALDVPIPLASRSDLSKYANAHDVSLSPATCRPFSRATKASRLQVVIEFYDYLRKSRNYGGDISAKEIKIDGVEVPSCSELVPKVRGKQPHPLTIPLWRKLREALGPLPSQAHAHRTARDRLLIELAMFTGLRLNEVLGLTICKFQALRPNLDAPGAFQKVHIEAHTAKGNVGRHIRIPNWLVNEVLNYLAEERARIVRSCPDLKPDQLFITTPRNGAYVTGLGRRRAQQIFSDALVAIGATSTAELKDPVTGSTKTIVRPDHRFHDLRHTYAVWQYYVEVRQGNREPWKKIQAQLGHAHLKTTMDTYITYVEIFDENERPVDIRALLGV